MAVPITCRLMRAAVDTDASIRCPMSRAADHRSDKKGSRMDGHRAPSLLAQVMALAYSLELEACIHRTCALMALVFYPTHTHTCLTGWPWRVALSPSVSLRRGSWIVSRVFLLLCGPGCQSTMSHGLPTGSYGSILAGILIRALALLLSVGAPWFPL